MQDPVRTYDIHEARYAGVKVKFVCEMVRKGREGRKEKEREGKKLRKKKLRMVTPPGKATASRHISAYPKVVILSHFFYFYFPCTLCMWRVEGVRIGWMQPIIAHGDNSA